MNKMQGIPEHLSAKEISERLGMTKKGIWKRATKGKWPFIEVPNKNGGGQQKLYALATLPEDVKYSIEKHLAGEIQVVHEKTFTAPVPVPQTTPVPSAVAPSSTPAIPEEHEGDGKTSTGSCKLGKNPTRQRINNPEAIGEAKRTSRPSQPNRLVTV